jgi:small ubiquitin-related modifier
VHAPREEPRSRTNDRGRCAQDGNEIFFKIKKSTPFRKLMDAYCKRQGTDENGILFLVDGQRLRPEQTPDEVRPTQLPLP